MKIVWSRLSLERIEEIADYIAYDSVSAANSWIEAVFEKIELLKTQPEMGRIVPELEIASIREMVFGNYRIIHRLTPKAIHVLTVRSFRQLLPLDDVEQ
ncbi:MAG: type II toxin-antitoxin system RelE/ParE family toxin [Chitinivibrionales bacterium]|nr:type II toxin-antitoxin system RelE/ParE family toxin [Chitinivibrionales bacterium]